MESRLESYQNKLIEKSLPLSERVVEAFYAHPRHLFVPEYLPHKAYEDRALSIYEKEPYRSTISQPSFVLRILDLMELEPGQKVYELGAGSGWNTALLAYLVGPSGQVISTEIIPEIAERAQKILRDRNVTNAMVLNRDGFEGAISEGPFDRIIFTAGSAEFPEKLFSSLKENGLMVFVRERGGSEDELLEVIRKKDGHAEVKISIPCQFVPVVRKKESHLEDGILE